ncbi:MAG TPA: metallopeptidase TldD-related protein [Streptosporangiaceae bacterium]|nr:metallopeptidase TldD-related protein [Streptosporangiaceae bacterium]
MPAETMQAWAGQDRALSALEEALTASSADQVEIFVAARTGEHTRFAGERVHQPQTIIECQVMVRAVAGTGSARVAVSSLRAARDAVIAASELARRRNGQGDTVPGNTVPGDTVLVDTVPAGGLPHGVAGYAGIAAPAGLWHEATLAFDAGARSALAGRIMDFARSADGVAAGVLTAAVTELAVVTTGGQRCYAAATEAGFSVTARAGEASSYVADLGRDASQLGVEERAAAAISQAAATSKVIAVPDGVHDVVFGGLATGELIGFLPDFGFTAPALAAGIGLVATRPDAVLAPPDITVADDATAGAGLPFPFDFEGTPKDRVELISAGRVGRPVSDLASAAATGGRSTGHAHIARESSPAPEAANLIMMPGGVSEAELIGGVERGLYIQRLWYNRLVDAEAGTVVGTSRDGCFLIEDGKLTAGLKTGRFTESVLGALARTDGIGSQLISQPVPNVWNGCSSAPAIRVRGFRFGSRQGKD